VDRFKKRLLKLRTLQFRYLSTPEQTLNSMAEDADKVTKKLIKIAIISLIIFILLIIAISAFNAAEISWNGEVIKQISIPDS
jgi:hypothetical protein